MQTLTIQNLRVDAAFASASKICYVLYPLGDLAEWMEEAARRYGLTIVAVTGMDWDDDLTPWPAKGEPPGSPDFKGLAKEFLRTLTEEVLPEAERRLGITDAPERTLVGVSLSGLFALWQWMVCDTFNDIISLSGSFWYEGFVKWLESQTMPQKSGRAYFLLGDREAHTNVKAFRSVQADTEAVVADLKSNGIGATFELVPGNHYQYHLQRLDRALRHLYS